MRNFKDAFVSKMRTGFRFLFTDPIALAKYIAIEFKNLKVILLQGSKIKITNDGERWDPNLSLGEADKSHLPRYYFAKDLIRKTDAVLDIACGTGYGTEILSKVCNKIVGVDISDMSVAYAKATRKGDNLDFMVADLYKNTIEADVVVSFETIEHIPGKSIQETVEKLLTFTKKMLIGSYPYKEKSGNNLHHFQFDLDEQNLTGLSEKLNINIFYQDNAGLIHKQKPCNDVEIQNLVFTIYK